MHAVPLQKWIEEGIVFKFIGDNIDKQTRVRDYRSDHEGALLHMFSLLASRSRTPVPHLQHTGQVSDLTAVTFLPQHSDVQAVKDNLVVLVSRILVKYIPALGFLSKVVTKHILYLINIRMQCLRSPRSWCWTF